MTTREHIDQDEISIKEIALSIREGIRYLVSKRRIIIGISFVGALVGLGYSIIKRPVYTAECTFVLENSDGTGGLSQYSSIASMVGVDLSGGGSNGIFQGENIFALYKSRLMIEKTLLTNSSVNGKVDLLVNHYIEFNRLRESWKENPSLSNMSFKIPKSKFTISQDSIVSTIVNDIRDNYLVVEKADKKLSVISVKVRAENEGFAKGFTERIVENVNSFYIQTKTKRSSANVRLLQKQADSLRRMLNSSIGSAASAIDANPNANAALQVLNVPSKRKQVDIQANSTMYGEILKNLEVAKISLSKETPLIQVIDQPVLPLQKSSLGKVTGAILGGVASGGGIVVLLLIQLVLKRLFKD